MLSRLHPYYTCGALARYIEIVGMDNIVQTCTYNISNMWNVVNLIIHCFPNFYFQGCAFYCLDLLLKDWGKEFWIIKRIVVFLSYGNTMIEWLLKVKSIVEQTINTHEHKFFIMAKYVKPTYGRIGFGIFVPTLCIWWNTF